MSGNVRRLSEDERYEQALAAAASERRNRPKHLLFIPMLLFMVTGLVLAFAIFSRESSRIRLDQQEQRFSRLVSGVVELRELRASRQDSGAIGQLDPIENLLSQMEGFATQAGLADKPKVPQSRRDRTLGTGVVRQRYVYSGVTDPSLEALLKWLHVSIDGVPGLSVFQLSLHPVAGRGWSMDVTFARWEREN